MDNNNNNNSNISEEQIKEVQNKIIDAKKEISKILIGQENLVDRLIGALFIRGHILLEGVPGIAKTTAILALAKVCDLNFKRVQFTPDLLPSDIIGNQIFNPKDQTFSVKKGPVFTNLFLADEINRSPAKVQSALLESMQEKQVTIGDETFLLPKIFMTLATQNPIEQEGTYPLPEAQIDRFFYKVNMSYPSRNEETQILKTIESQDFKKLNKIFNENEILEIQKIIDNIYIDDVIIEYITKLVEASRNPLKYNIEELDDQILFGASPRGSINLMRAAKIEALFSGRNFVTTDDVKASAHDILRHRITPSFEAEADGVTSDKIISIILNNIETP